VHTMTTTSEISYEMAEELELPDPSQYGIFQSGTDGGRYWNVKAQILGLPNW